MRSLFRQLPSLLRSPALVAIAAACAIFATASTAATTTTAKPTAPHVTFTPVLARTYPRPVETLLEAQIALARHGISCGPIDGRPGAQTAAALSAFQQSQNLPVTGLLDAATRTALVLNSPPLCQFLVTADDLAHIQPLSPTWLGKSQQTALDYPRAIELVAERAHAGTAFIQRLNPTVNWSALPPGTLVTIPDIALAAPLAKAAIIHISLGAHTLEARDATGALLVHFPVSIARLVEKRPVGELHVTVVIANPDYTFDPALFPESPEAHTIDHRLILPPGPRNPVGVAWIGLDRTGYGIHGTPVPENVGRTESHGCFRLANWDARTLLTIAWVGLPVIVEP